MVLYPGQGVGLARRVQSAPEIVREVADEAVRALDGAREEIRDA
jgi:hypothetical protein